MVRRAISQPASGNPQIRSDFVGERLGSLFRAEAAPALITGHLHVSRMAVTEVRSPVPTFSESEPTPREDAHLIGLILSGMQDRQLWADGRAMPKLSASTGQVILRDLNQSYIVLNDQPLHFMLFYMPRAVLDEIAEDLQAPRIAELQAPQEVFDDPVVTSLGRALLPSFRRPEPINQMFLESVSFAIASHVAQAYGGLQPGWQPPKGGLAGWQEKRAKEALSASLKGEATLRDVAKQCGLSVSHFSHAFKDTTGVAPHQWLVQRRVEVAKSLLKAGRLSLSDIAMECGFANQSHFTRVFSRIAGLTPGAWRRCCEIEEVE